MNWDAIGAIAEMLGALAVIISLLYLASQVRQNTVASRFSRYDSFVRTIGDIRSSIFDNEALSRIWEVGLRAPSELDDVENTRLRLLLYNAVQTLESLHLQLTQSGLDTEIWSRQLPVINRILGSSGGAKGGAIIKSNSTEASLTQWMKRFPSGLYGTFTQIVHSSRQIEWPLLALSRHLVRGNLR